MSPVAPLLLFRTHTRAKRGREGDDTTVRFSSTGSGQQPIISIAGRLEERHFAELEKHCTDARQAVVFDLAELLEADETSIRWLRARMEKGDRVTGASLYIDLLLEPESAGKPATGPVSQKGGI